MSEETKQGVAAEAPVKKHRRGVSNETKAVSQLKFHEKDAAQNGLFIGHLEEVKVDWAVAREGSTFGGMKMPYLTFHFASNHPKAEEQRHVYNTLFPVESNIDTIPGGNSAWRVDNVLNWIKHMLDVFYLRSRLLTEEEEDAMSLPFDDVTEEGEYNPIDPQEVLNGYGAMFTNVVNIMNGNFNLKDGETPKPCYKDANGKPIVVWMKLLRHKKTKKGWTNVGLNGDLAFDTFIGAGAIELFKGQGTFPTILRLDVSKESITPKDTKKEPTIGGEGIPGMMPGGAVIPGAMPAGMSMDNSAFAAAAEGDLPF